MRAKLAGLFWLASVAGAAAFDIENHARWVVLDDMPLLASGQPIQPQVSSLRTVDIAAQPRLRAAVCGTLDFQNTDDGVADFVAFYSMNDDGKMAMVGRPYFYGPIVGPHFDSRHEIAVGLCGHSTEATVVAATGVAARTEAAAVAVRP